MHVHQRITTRRMRDRTVPHVLQNVRGFRKKKWLKEYGRSREKNKRTQLTDLTNIYEIKSRKPTVTSRGSSAYKPTISHGHVDKQRVINLAK
uniref:Uncharacterized protein n=1 Tax=Lactuca sativa TaxID=4236 RepID=A0A9R1XQC3_LACSA|nr:hypothetical protein LSAT_V11C300152370 [Lactuca sativa]